MTDKEIDRIIKANIKMAGFISLVKRMREAQKQWKDGDPFDGTEMELAKRMCEAEREVDEYLKKMENIDQRKALEAENTEFEYGHNVKHYREN
jgi:DNA repair exonuclease SbcCD nuclease subunit